MCTHVCKYDRHRHHQPTTSSTTRSRTPERKTSAAALGVAEAVVKAAKQGNLGKNDQAKLERTLILFWSNQLNLNDKSPKIILSTIKSHPEAKPLFQKLESWFHSPQPEEPSDLDALLEPYSKPKIN